MTLETLVPFGHKIALISCDTPCTTFHERMSSVTTHDVSTALSNQPYTLARRSPFCLSDSTETPNLSSTEPCLSVHAQSIACVSTHHTRRPLYLLLKCSNNQRQQYRLCFISQVSKNIPFDETQHKPRLSLPPKGKVP